MNAPAAARLFIVSMRNQDGTQYRFKDDFGVGWTDDRREASPLTEAEFNALRNSVEESRLRDCPDNGFFGIYNLTATPYAPPAI